MADGIPSLPISSGIMKIALTGGIILVGVIALSQVAKGFKGLNLFGTANADSGQGGQQVDQATQLQKAEAETTRANAEISRTDAEIIRAEAEGRTAEAEFLRAQAEILRAEAEKGRDFTERLKNEQLSIQNGATLDGSEQTQKEKVVLETQQEVQQIEKQQVETQNFQQSKPAEIIKTANEIQNNPATIQTIDNTRDSTLTAIETINKKRRSGRNSTFFSNGSTSQINVVSQSDRPVTITGGGSSSKNGADFTIRDTPLRTLSDVLKKFPNFTASQARDFLSRQGTHSTDQAVNKVQKNKFNSFDFGVNTGSGSRGTNERFSKTTRQLEIEKAEKIRDQLIANSQPVISTNEGQKA